MKLLSASPWARALPVFIAFVISGVYGATASAQTTPIFAMDCRGGAAYPSCGWGDTKSPDNVWTRTLRVGASPSGRDAVEFAMLPSTSTDQKSLGWGQRLTMEGPVAQGQSRYVRYRFKVLAPINWDGVNASVGNKTAIIGNTAGGPCAGDSTGRIINDIAATHSSGPYDRLDIRLTRNIDGAPTRVLYDPGNGLVAGVWYNVQFRARSSSTATTPDGGLTLWVNNNNFSSPNAHSTGYVVRSAHWSDSTCDGAAITFGFAASFHMQEGGNAVFQLADYEYDDQFDPNWHIGGRTTASPPSAPINVRIISGALLFPLTALPPALLRRIRRHRPTQAGSGRT